MCSWLTISSDCDSNNINLQFPHFRESEYSKYISIKRWTVSILSVFHPHWCCGLDLLDLFSKVSKYVYFWEIKKNISILWPLGLCFKHQILWTISFIKYWLHWIINLRCKFLASWKAVRLYLSENLAKAWAIESIYVLRVYSLDSPMTNPPNV